VEIVLAVATILGGLTAVWFFWDKVAPWFRRQRSMPTDLAAHPAVGSAERASHRDELARYLKEAQALRSRLGEQPLPDADHNAWVEKVSLYLRDNLGASFEVRFSDFSGMAFYGVTVPRSPRCRVPWKADRGGYMSSLPSSADYRKGPERALPRSPNIAVEQTAGSHPLAAAAHRERWADNGAQGRRVDDH
jgi:hypothetical protein